MIRHLVDAFKRFLRRLIIRHHNRRITRRIHQLRKQRQPPGTIQCPRCRRHVPETVNARNAHKQSCVKIPAPHQRGPDWGVKMSSREDPDA